MHFLVENAPNRLPFGGRAPPGSAEVAYSTPPDQPTSKGRDMGRSGRTPFMDPRYAPGL